MPYSRSNWRSMPRLTRRLERLTLLAGGERQQLVVEDCDAQPRILGRWWNARALELMAKRQDLRTGDPCDVMADQFVELA